MWTHHYKKSSYKSSTHKSFEHPIYKTCLAWSNATAKILIYPCFRSYILEEFKQNSILRILTSCSLTKMYWLPCLLPNDELESYKWADLILYSQEATTTSMRKVVKPIQGVHSCNTWGWGGRGRRHSYLHLTVVVQISHNTKVGKPLTEGQLTPCSPWRLQARTQIYFTAVNNTGGLYHCP